MGVPDERNIHELPDEYLQQAVCFEIQWLGEVRSVRTKYENVNVVAFLYIQ
jgi:hypothetical protein